MNGFTAANWFARHPGLANGTLLRQVQRGQTLHVDSSGITGMPVQGDVSVVEADPYYPSSSDDAARGDNLAYLDEDGSVQLVGLKDIPADKLPAWKKQARSSGKASDPLPHTPSWKVVVGVGLGLVGGALALAGFVYMRRWRQQWHAERMAAMARQLECTGFNDDVDDIPELRAYKLKGAALAEMGLVEKQQLDMLQTNLPTAKYGGAAAGKGSISAGVASPASSTPKGDASGQGPAKTPATQADGTNSAPAEGTSATDEGGAAGETPSSTAADIILEEAWTSLGADSSQLGAPKAAKLLKIKQHQQQTFNAWFTNATGTPKAKPGAAALKTPGAAGNSAAEAGGSSGASNAADAGLQQINSGMSPDSPPAAGQAPSSPAAATPAQKLNSSGRAGGNKRWVRRRASVAAEVPSAGGPGLVAEDGSSVGGAGALAPGRPLEVAGGMPGATPSPVESMLRPGTSSSTWDDPPVALDSRLPRASSGLADSPAATIRAGRLGPQRWQAASPRGANLGGTLSQQQPGAGARGQGTSSQPAAEQRGRAPAAMLQVDLPGGDGHIPAGLPGYTPTPTGDAQPQQRLW